MRLLVTPLVLLLAVATCPLHAQTLELARGYRLVVPADTAFGDAAWLDAERSGGSRIVGDNGRDEKFGFVGRFEVSEPFAAALRSGNAVRLEFATLELTAGSPASPARVWLLHDTDRGSEVHAAAAEGARRIGEFPVQSNTAQSFTFAPGKPERGAWQRDDWILIGIETDTTLNGRDDHFNLDNDSFQLTAAEAEADAAEPGPGPSDPPEAPGEPQ